MTESTGKLAACATDLRRAGIHNYLARLGVIPYRSKNRKLLHRLVLRLAPQISVHILLLATPAIASAQAVDANVDATVRIIGYDRMEVRFNFPDAQNRPEYTVVKVGPKEDSQADYDNPPFLLGKLSKSAIASSSEANHILVGVSGAGNPSAAINISNFQAAGEASGKHSFQIGFLRSGALKKTSNSIALSIPGITYGQVTHVSVVKPSWSSEVLITYPSGIVVTADIGGIKSFDLKDDGLVSFNVVVQESSSVKRYSRIILDNVIFFTGTVVIGAIFAFLAPPQAHRAARILLGIMAAVLGIWMVREIWFSPQPKDVENYAPVISATLGLLVCSAFFERLDKLVQLFGK